MATLTSAQALNNAHKLEMQRDPNIYVAGEDVGVYGGIFGVTGGLLDQCGDKRVRDTPITESAIIGTAVGAVAAGLRPVFELMFVFDHHSSLGLVKLRVRKAGAELAQIFEQLMLKSQMPGGRPTPFTEITHQDIDRLFGGN